MLTINNKVLNINGNWLNPNGAPEPPPSGQWYTLFEGQYGDLSIYSASSYIKSDTYIKTSTTSTSKVQGQINLYKSVSIPVERQNDDYLLLEFPYFPWRASKQSGTVLSQDICRLSVDIRGNSSYNTGYLFNITSLPISQVWEDIDYGVYEWTSTLSYQSYTETMNHIQPGTSPGEIPGIYIRLLFDLHTHKLYFYWSLTKDLPEQIRISDFIDENVTLTSISDICTISVHADGYGYAAKSSTPNNYLMSGYASDHTGIRLKSYKGTL